MSGTKNYNEEQKLYLLRRIRGVVDTVENPRKETTTTLRRKAVWDNLANRFNGGFPSRRPSSRAHLKNRWKRLKWKRVMLLLRPGPRHQSIPPSPSLEPLCLSVRRSERPPRPASSGIVPTLIRRQARRLPMLSQTKTSHPPAQQVLKPTPSTTREPDHGVEVRKAPHASRLLRGWPELLPRFEQHMLDMSREEHEQKMELIRAQARRDEELHRQRRRALRAKSKA
ncbi:unnamed protein product [Boreogadus saida]